MNKKQIFQYIEYSGYRCLAYIPPQNQDLYLTYCGMSQCSPHEFWGPRARPDWHMHFVLSGSGYFEIQGKKYHIKAGQIFLLPPNKNVYYYSAQSDPWYYAWASFNGTKVESYLAQSGFSHDILVRDCVIHPGEFAVITNQMLLANTGSLKDALIRTGCLYQLFALLIKSNHSVHSPKISIEQKIQYAIQYITYNYTSDIQISDIASYLNLDRSYFSKEFKKQVSLTPKQFLINYRMEKAKSFLKETSISISEIAQRVGYKDITIFSKIFNKLVGISPSTYRKYSHVTEN